MEGPREQTPQQDNEEIPASIGPYRITGKLGHGGMGVVYAGRHMESGELAAVKTLLSASETVLAGIRREIDALGRVQHPGVVRIIGSGILDTGLPWYAMEHLHGLSLRSYLRDRPISHSIATNDLEIAEAHPSIDRPLTWQSRRDLLRIVRRLCGALSFLHGSGIVHRDLKPDNVLVREDGSPVLLDFGLVSRFGGARGREELASDAALIGTYAYMSPEQIRGEFVDARTDLYALGCMLYECIVGRPPFTGKWVETVLHAHRFEQPVPPSQLVDEVPPELDELILRLLEKQPQDRLGYTADVAHVLASLEGEPEPTPMGQPYVYRPSFTGRAGALRELEEAISRVADRRMGGTIFIGGESGVGKTRLAMEAVRTATRKKLAVVVGQCATLGVGAKAAEVKTAPLYPFAPLLLAVADRCHERGSAETSRLLGPRAKVLVAYQPALAGVPGYDREPDPPELDAPAARDRVLNALAETLTAFARVRPLLLVIDDLQWADDLSSSFLQKLATTDPPTPGVLVISTYRMEEMTADLDAVIRAPFARRIDLERFGAADVGAMVRGMLALREPPARLVDFLVRQCDGNPFFIAEYLLAAINHGVLTRDHAGWQLGDSDQSGPPLDLSLPGTLAELIEQRLHGLGAGEGALVRLAAVLGREFPSDLLLEIAGADAGGGAALHALQRRQIFEDVEAGKLRFVHDKIREIAYERADETERRHLHRRAAEVIEAHPERSSDAYPSLGYHFAKAGIHDKAYRYLAEAGDRAQRAYANGDAIVFYTAAIEQARDLAQSAGGRTDADVGPKHALHERLGDVLAFTGQQEVARVAYAEALDQPDCTEPLLRARLHRNIGKTWEVEHQHPRASQHYADAAAALGAEPAAPSDDWWHECVQINLDRMWVSYWMNRVDDMSVLLDEVRPMVEKHGTSSQRVRFFQLVAMRNTRVERYRISAETLGYARTAAAESEELPDIKEQSAARFVLFFSLVLHGSFDEAEQLGLAVLKSAERTGAVTLRIRCLTYLMLISRRRGNVEATRRRATEYQSAPTAGRMDEYRGAVQANLAWVALCDGDVEEAERLAREALEIWRPQVICYPMQWLARWPLLAIDHERGRLKECVEHVEALLDTRQQRLEEEVLDPLASAKRAWGSRDAPRVTADLGAALAIARRKNYL